MSIVHIAFYPSDWLAGTRGLSDSETGIYITLIARMYEMAGPLERDDNRLWRLCGCRSKASFVKALEYLVSEGKIIEAEGSLFNDRVQKEIEKATEKSSAAKLAANTRWNKKPNKNNDSKNTDASGAHMRTACQPEPESETVKKEEPIGSSKKASAQKRKTSLPPDWRLPQEWGYWAVQQGMDEDAVRGEAEQFKDHHIGRGNMMLDWQRTWQTWVRNHFKFNRAKPKASDHPQPESYARQVLRQYAGVQ